jgi:hypothetical protein
LKHDVQSAMIVSVIEIPKSGQSELCVEMKKKTLLIPLSSISNDAGVSSSLIRFSSYNNLTKVSWPRSTSVTREGIKTKLTYYPFTVVEDTTHLISLRFLPTLFANALRSLESFVVHLILKNTSSYPVVVRT